MVCLSLKLAAQLFAKTPIIPLDGPLITIDGIGDAEMAREKKQVGADCVTVIGVVMQNGDVPTCYGKCHNKQV